MKVLHVAPAFWPATYWGGPIFSTYGLCSALAAMPGIELKVLTADAAGPQFSQRVKVEAFPMCYPAGYEVYFTHRILGQGIAPGLLARLCAMVRWADVVHLNFTYSFPTIPTLAACRFLRKPLVWSPHGALLATHNWEAASKPRLKKVWERVCSALMPNRCVLHVTSEAERAASLARLRRAQGVIVPNGVESADDLPPRTWRPDGRLRLMYIGRLDSRKGLENLLRAINRLDGMSVTLDIYGTGEQRYAASLAELSRALGLSERVRFQGHVETGAKRNAFLSADVCVVPSTTENFGMVVAEALAHGVPVIASRGTPWAEVESHNCGLWVDNTPSELAGAIERVRDMDLKTMGERGRKWMRDEFRWESIASRMYRVYEGLTRICAS